MANHASRLVLKLKPACLGFYGYGGLDIMLECESPNISNVILAIRRIFQECSLLLIWGSS
uniref:Uncharacterized protein n=1 Tax=Ignisphaera aggregans TaxID=334771 RepID=A0A7C4D038_9CREN